MNAGPLRNGTLPSEDTVPVAIRLQKKLARLVAPLMLCHNQAGTGAPAREVRVGVNASAVPAKTADKSSQAVTNSIRLRTV